MSLNRVVVVDGAACASRPIVIRIRDGKLTSENVGSEKEECINLPKKTCRTKDRGIYMSQWLTWAKRIQALSQAGLTFTRDQYDRERYEELQEIVREMYERHSDLSNEAILQLVHVDGYPTPKLDVRGVIFKDDRILLVKERSDGLWTLPGGFCEVNRSPASNIIKEVEEEAGLDVIPVRLLALFDMHEHPHPPLSEHYYKLFIECALIGDGEGSAGVETSDVGFFERDDLPDLSLARNTIEQIHMCFDAHWQEEDWTTLFD